jgi:hypothetical protein
MKIIQKVNSIIYPKWIHKVPIFPTEEQFIEAFFELYEHHPDECRWSIDVGGLEVSTPTSHVFDGGIIGTITDQPVTKKSLFWKSGPNWDTDDNGNRFYLLEIGAKKNIRHFDRAYYSMVIYNYLSKEHLREEKLKLIFEND